MNAPLENTYGGVPEQFLDIAPSMSDQARSALKPAFF
jgi:hypothetical protein